MMKIKAVWGREPLRENEYPTHFVVGDDGVTEIVFDERVLGTYGVASYLIKKGDHIAAELMLLDTGLVQYFDE